MSPKTVCMYLQYPYGALVSVIGFARKMYYYFGFPFHILNFPFKPRSVGQTIKLLRLFIKENIDVISYKRNGTKANGSAVSVYGC